MDWDIQERETCTSTMDEAAKLAADGAPEGTVVVAKQMEEGRGQHGRAWHAPEGGLYLSFILRDGADPRFLTLAIGNAVADVLEVAGVEPQMKWVNDIWVGGKKIAGILVEAESLGSGFSHMVVGIGINANGSAQDWPHPLHETATTLEQELGADQCIPDLQVFLLESIETWLGRLREGDTQAILAAWRDRDALVDQTVGFDPDGDFCTKLIGTCQGIDDEGRLRIDVDGEEQVFSSGTVFPHDG